MVSVLRIEQLTLIAFGFETGSDHPRPGQPILASFYKGLLAGITALLRPQELNHITGR